MTGLIILAAGSSSRLGQPKQNLLFNGKTLLQQTIETALGTVCEPVIVVLGANADLITSNFQQNNLTVVHNPHWAEGMASSIRKAVSEAEKHDELDSVLILLCDQPFVSVELINDMVHKVRETGKAIVACSYQGTVGVPVLFDRSLFGELLLLKGQEGAKKVLLNYPNDIFQIPFDKGAIDIDTPEDYEKLNGLS